MIEMFCLFLFCCKWDSNPEPIHQQVSTLPTELLWLLDTVILIIIFLLFLFKFKIHNVCFINACTHPVAILLLIGWRSRLRVVGCQLVGLR